MTERSAPLTDLPPGVPRRGHRVRRPAALLTLVAAGACVAGVLTPLSASAVGTTLTRYPYLTDITTTSVQVTFDTTSKLVSVNGAVRWGTPSGATGCTLTGSSVAASTTTLNAPVTVSGVAEYSSSVTVSGLAPATTYCYRVSTGGSTGTDLLGTDPAPRFTTLKTTGPVRFAVLGDWGDNTIAAGANQKAVDALIAGSGASFAVSTGDIAYDTGTQTNYGNLVATGSRVSQVFGPDYWKAPGATTPLFSTAGNHGRTSTFLQVWKQPRTVAATPGQKYLMESYSGRAGTTAASYPSVWYAFTVGGYRLYVLDADWADTNLGTSGDPYAVDQAYHWADPSPELTWLKTDLAANAGTPKLAFFHFPLRADSATEPGDPYLQADPDKPADTSRLEALLSRNGVKLAFNGHAHIYQRNVAPPGGLTSYVTGGGGAKVSPVKKSACASTDAYAVGWAYASAAGSRCGAAPVPTSDAQVYHFLTVDLNGSTVTVTPTNAQGAVFDKVTYDFSPDSVRPAAPSGATATVGTTTTSVNWSPSTSGDVSAQDVYRNGTWVATVLPGITSWTDKAPVAGASYTVRAHDLAGNQSADSNVAGTPAPPPATPVPSAPTGLTVTGSTGSSISLAWNASPASEGVSVYRVYRGGAQVGSSTTTAYTDSGLTPSTTYQYTVAAVNAGGAGLQSPPVPGTTTATPAPATDTVLTPVADATIDPAVSTPPTASRLKVDASSPTNDMLLRFTTGCTTVSRAVLQLTVGSGSTDPSVRGGDWYATSSADPNAAWAEGSVLWSTAPAALTGHSASITTAVTGGATYTVDVTSLVPSTGGTFTLRGSNTSGDGAGYFSKEGSSTQGPRLTVTCG